MDAIGLYYPYFHVRDDSWLKQAALYLPKVARIHPPDHPYHDSPTAKVLRDELDFLFDIDPAPYSEEVVQALEALMQQEREQLLRLYAIPGRRTREFRIDREGVGPFAWLHESQAGAGGLHRWHDSFPEMTVFSRGSYQRCGPITWIGMHPRIVSVYSRALVERIARANDLTPVTDDPRFFGTPNWSVDDLTEALLDWQGPTGDSRIWPDGLTNWTRHYSDWRGHDPAEPLFVPENAPAVGAYACAALKVILPESIEHIPAQDIVRARLRLADEFEAFCAHLNDLGREFARLDTLTDPGVVQARIDAMVNRNLTRPLRDLERGLRSLGLKPAREVMALKSLELPALGALGAHAMNLSPVLGAGGVVAVQLVASVRTARKTAAEQRQSAAGYLLGLRGELKPALRFLEALGRNPTRPSPGRRVRFGFLRRHHD